METIKEALTFDDVTLAPNYSEILPSEVNTSINLTESLNIKIPLLSSAMDTVTESSMGIAMGQAGGLGIIHRNLSIEEQIKEIRKVKSKKILVGAAVGASDKELKRAQKILKENLDIIVIDTAHGHTKKVGNIIKKIKKLRPKKTAICAGNIATAEAAKFLVELGVDIIKVGIGPGSICTTRLVAGIGVPQLSAILNVKKGIGKNKTRIIEDIRKLGVQEPRLYAAGFAHNNCGGFCVKAGIGQMVHLWKTLPERYLEHEQKELEFQEFIGSEVTILTETRNGEKRNLSLQELRKRAEQGEEFRFNKGTACACLNPASPEADGIAW